jgi:hypothetical protein
MKKLILYFLLLLSIKGFAQTPITFSSLTPYNGSMDSLRAVVILKSGNVWTNRTVYYGDLTSGLFKLTDTASAFSTLRSYVQNNFALLGHTHVIGDVTGLQASLDSKLNTSDSAAMLSAYRIQMIANAAAIGLKVGYGDTANMLSNYAKLFQVPTNNNQLSNGAGYITSSAISGKLNSSDTANMLNAYRLSIIANSAGIASNTSAITTKVNISDTTGMLSNYRTSIIANAASLTGKLNKTDTSAMLSNYLTAIIQNASNISVNSAALSGKLNATGGDLTGTSGNGYIGFPSQSSTPSTPSSGVRMFANASGYWGWVNNSGYTREFRSIGQTQNNIYYLPDVTNQTIATKEDGLGRMVISDNTQKTNTGNTTENTVFTGTIKANSLGANGTCEIRILVTWPSNTNNKNFKIKINGTNILSVGATTSQSGNWMVRFSNRGVTNSQIFEAPSGANAGQIGWGTSANGITTAAFDTTQDLTLTVTCTDAVSTDVQTVESIQVIVYYKD